MKVKFADKIYDVLYSMNILGKTIYAIEDEPNHIDWLVNVEVINEENPLKGTLGDVFDDLRAGLDPSPRQNKKYKVGDFIKHNRTDIIYKIIEVKNDYYRAEYTATGDKFKVFTAEDNFHLWTIKDAKDGDVLIDKSNNREYPFIFKETKPSEIKTDCLNPLTVLGYCGIGGAGFTKSSGWGDTANCIYYPATKEQRDLLFQKMKEAGYEWDGDNKELKPKFKVGDWIVFNGLTLYINEVVKGYYRTISKDGIPNSYDWDIDNAARLWTIKEARDGDVLKEDSCIFIIEKMKSKGTALTHYCLFDDGEFDSVGSILSFDVNSTYPATKEQRDLLFAKMKEAGYK